MLEAVRPLTTRLKSLNKEMMVEKILGFARNSDFVFGMKRNPVMESPYTGTKFVLKVLKNREGNRG